MKKRVTHEVAIMAMAADVTETSKLVLKILREQRKRKKGGSFYLFAESKIASLTLLSKFSPFVTKKLKDLKDEKNKWAELKIDDFLGRNPGKYKAADVYTKLVEKNFNDLMKAINDSVGSKHSELAKIKKSKPLSMVTRSGILALGEFLAEFVVWGAEKHFFPFIPAIKVLEAVKSNSTMLKEGVAQCAEFMDALDAIEEGLQALAITVFTSFNEIEMPAEQVRKLFFDALSKLDAT